MTVDNVTLWRRLSAQAMKDPGAVLPPRSRALARHEGGHAAAAVALGGVLIGITLSIDGGGECTAAIPIGSRADDAQWAQAVFLWAGPLAAGTLAGAYTDLAKIRALGRRYLVDRGKYSAFTAARLIVERKMTTARP